MAITNPLVSIVIPSFNSELYIEDTLQSALAQSYSNIEIIVIDDGSTDASAKIILSKRKQSIRYYSQENKGAAAARNLGIQKARGEYIQFLDADDIIPPHKIAKQVEILREHGEDCLIGCMWQRFKGGPNDLIGTVMPFSIDKDVYEYNSVEWLIQRPMMIPHTWLVSKALIKKSGLWNEKLTLNDDGEFFYRVIRASSKILVAKTTVLYRSFNNNSLSSRNDRKAMISWIESAKTYKKYMLEIGTDAAIRSSDNLYFQIAFSCLNKFQDLHNECLNNIVAAVTSNNYHTGNRIVDRMSPYIGIASAKRLHDFNYKVRNHSIVRFLLRVLRYAK